MESQGEREPFGAAVCTALLKDGEGVGGGSREGSELRAEAIQGGLEVEILSRRGFGVVQECGGKC